MAESSDEFSFINSKEGIDSIKVQVKFSGIKKEDLDGSGKILQLRNLKIPMSRLGSWVFQCVQQQEDVDKVIKGGGPAVAFLWALHGSYPEISAWVDDPCDCSFVLEVEKKEKKRILGEIGGNKMKTKVQEILSENQNLDLKISLIKIVTDKPAVAATLPQPTSIAQSSSSRSSPKLKKSSSKTAPPSDSPSSTENDWKCIKLKSELEKTEDKKERLIKLTEFAICSYRIERYKNESVLEEIKMLIPKVRLSQDDLKTILKELRILSQLCLDDDKIFDFIEILLSSAELVKKIIICEDRIDIVNSDLKKICATVAKIYSIKQSCFQVSVEPDDELVAGASKPDKGSGTMYAQASRAQQNGKRAMKKYDFVEALACCDAAIRLQPKEMFYHLDKAEVFLAMGKLENCKEECNEALHIGGTTKNRARAHTLLAEAELRQYLPLTALISFQKSIDLNSDHDVQTKFTSLNKEFDKGVVIRLQRAS